MTPQGLDCFAFRFLEALTSRRREQQEKLAEKAIEEAARKTSEDIAATAVAAAQQNGVAASAPVTPATTPVASNALIIKEGLKLSTISDLILCWFYLEKIMIALTLVFMFCCYMVKISFLTFFKSGIY